MSSTSLNSSDDGAANENRSSSSSNFFQISEDDQTPKNSPAKALNSSYPVSVDLHSPNSQDSASSYSGVMFQRSRKLSNSSMSSDFRLPMYDSQPVSTRKKVYIVFKVIMFY